MNTSTPPKDYCQPITEIISDSRWGGFPILKNSIDSPVLIKHTEQAVTGLCVRLQGSSAISWTAKQRDHRRIVKPGTFVYCVKGYEFRNIIIEGGYFGLMLSLEENSSALWGGEGRDLILQTMKFLPQYLIHDDSYLALIIQGIRSEIELDYPSGKIFGESMSMALLSYIVGRYGSESIKKLAVGMPIAHLKRVKDYIETNLENDLTLPELANIVNVSPSHFSRSFKKATGMPVYQYILNERMKAAQTLLLHAEGNITEVACKTGFSNVSHFSNTFKKHVGVSPKRFYKENC